jgi:hypothetical protein
MWSLTFTPGSTNWISRLSGFTFAMCDLHWREEVVVEIVILDTADSAMLLPVELEESDPMVLVREGARFGILSLGIS